MHRLFALIGWIVLSISGVAVHAQMFPIEMPRTAVSEQRIRAALKEDTRLEFIETPLEDVVNFLQDMHDISIQIDTRALDDIGIATDTPITRNLRGISLGSALSLMLRDLDLVYVLRDEVLLITTEKESKGLAKIQVYPVGDLVPLGSPADELAKVLATVLEAGAKPVEAADVQTCVLAYQQLLIVRATETEHQRVQQLLTQMHLAGRGPLQRSSPTRRSANWTPPSEVPLEEMYRKIQDHLERHDRAHARSSRKRAGSRADSSPGGGEDPFGGSDPGDPFGEPAKSSDEKPEPEDPFGGGASPPDASAEDPFG